MAGEAIVVVGTPKTLEASGASAANLTVTQANDATYGIVADGASFPDAKFVLAVQHATAVVENTYISLFARPLNIDSTNDSEVPEAARPTAWIGTFTLNNAAINTNQYMELIARDVPWVAEYYIYNASGQTISAGWTLKVTPFSYKAA
jgi:hypothetical protein